MVQEPIAAAKVATSNSVTIARGKRHEIVLTPDGRTHEHEEGDDDGEHDDD